MIYRKKEGAPPRHRRFPAEEIERIRKQMDRLSEIFSGNTIHNRPHAGVFPLINIGEDDRCFYIRAELPGVKSGDLDIQATAGKLAISGERKNTLDPKEIKYHRKERETGRFSRVIPLPENIDPEHIEAKLKHGVLTIIVPKTEIARPQKITVN